MFLEEENFIDIINGYPLDKWQPLLNLIPEIEASNNFGQIDKVENPEENVIYIPDLIEADIVSQFRQIVFEIPILVVFDWSSWSEGINILRQDNFNYDSIDLPTKCKIITAIVRSDRFSNGALISAFESGLILQILKSMENQLIRG